MSNKILGLRIAGTIFGIVSVIHHKCLILAILGVFLLAH